MTTLEQRLDSLISMLGVDFKLGAVPLVYNLTGSMSTRTGRMRVGVLGSGLIVGVKAFLDTAPTGTTTFKIDINKNSTSIYGTQANRPTWVSGSIAATVGSHSVTSYADGDNFSFDIDAVGNTVAGSDLTVSVWVLRTGN